MRGLGQLDAKWARHVAAEYRIENCMSRTNYEIMGSGARAEPQVF